MTTRERRKHYAVAFPAQLENARSHVDPKHGSVLRTLGVLERLKPAIEQLIQTASDRYPNETPEAHEQRIYKNAEKLRKAREAVNADFDATVGREVSALQAQLDARVNLKPNEFAQEIRATFRNMKSGQQIDFLNELVAENDGPSLAAIIKAPKSLTGLPKDMASNYVEIAYSKHAPEAWDEMRSLMGIVATRLDILRTADDAVAEYADPVRLAEIAKKEETARQAQERFDASTGSA